MTVQVSQRKTAKYLSLESWSRTKPAQGLNPEVPTVAVVSAEEKLRVAAQGEADAQLMRARAEAEAIAIKARALRDNPDIIQLNAIEKWDGRLPSYLTAGSAMPFVPVK